MEPHTRTLLAKSAADRDALNQPLDPSIAGFHAQQAVEKLLKALLNEAGVVYPRIHNLVALAGLVLQRDQPLPALPLTWQELTNFAVSYRYDELPQTEEPDVPALRASVDALRAHVEVRVQALAAAKPGP